MKRKVMNLQEGKLLKTWLKRKVRVTEALIVAFFIAGNLGWAQESSNNNSSNGDSNTIEDGIAIGRLVKVKIGKGNVIEPKEKKDNDEYSFAEKGNAKAQLDDKYRAGFHLNNMKNGNNLINRYNGNYETVIGKIHNNNGNNGDKYANSTTTNGQSSASNSENDKLAKSIAIGGDSVARNASIAIGDYAFASKKENGTTNGNGENNVIGAAIAIGSFATATASSAISLGAAASAQGSNSIALGRQSVAVQETSIAVGKVAAAVGQDSLALGQASKAEANEAIAIGKEAHVENNALSSIAIGSNSKVKQQSGIAIGNKTEADGQKSIVIGDGSKVKKLEEMKGIDEDGGSQTEDTKAKATKKVLERLKTKTLESGTSSQSNQTNPLDATVILGASSTATGQYGVTLGHQVHNYGDDGISIGNQSLVSGHRAIAIGKFAGAYHDSSIALGYDVEAHSLNGIAIGTGAIEKGNQGIALGNQAKSKGNDSIAIGTLAMVGNGNMNNIKVSSQNHIHEDSPKEGEKEVEKAVAIGRSAKVEISNSVALGADSEAKKYEKVEEVKIKPLGLNSMNGQVNSQDEIKIPTEKFAGMKKNGNGSSGTNGNGDLSVVSIGKSGAERQLQHVAAGRINETSTDAINGSQLFAVANKLAEGWKIADSSGEKGNVTLNKKVSFVGENGAMVKVEKDTENGYKVKISAPQTKVTSKDGSVQVLGMSDAEDRHNIYDISVRQATLSLSEDKQSVQSDLDISQNAFVTGANASKAITEAMQSARTELENGKNTKVIPYTGLKGQNLYKINVEGDLQDINSLQNGSTKITLKKEEKEVDMGGSKITNIEKGTKAKDAVNVSQLRESEKKGLNFMGNDGNNIHRNLGQTLRIKGEGVTQKQSKEFKSAKGNINVKQNGKSILEVQLAKDLKHIESISNGGEKTGTKITLGKNKKEVNVNNAKITNVADGTSDTDAVNLSQLRKEISDNAYTFTVSANNGEKDTINRKDNVNFADSRNIHVNYDKTKKTFSYDLNHELTVGKKSSVFEEDGKDGKVTVVGKKDASVTLNGENGSIGLQGPKGADGKDGTKATIKVAQGKDDLDGKNGENGKTRLVYETVDSQNPKETITEEVATLKDGLKFQGDDEKIVSKKLNETLSIKGGAEGTLTDGNIGVVSENGELKIKLAQNLENMNKITFGYSEADPNSTVSLSKDGLNNGGKKITHVGDGEISETSKDAVNGSQLYKLKGELSSQGLDFAGNDGTKVHRNLGTVLSLKGEGVSEEEAKTFHSASGNINVKRNKDDELLLQLAEKLQNIQSISNGKSSGSTMILLKEKEVVINKDLNMSGNQIKHLKEGTESTDAVNKGQLDREVAKASTEVKAGKNIEVKESIGNNGQKQYEVGLKDSITLGEKVDSKVIVDGTTGKVTIGDKISLDGKTGSASFGKIQMNQEKNEKGDTKATIIGLENTDITAPDFAKKGRAATEEQLQKVHQDADKKIENLSREITNKGLNFGADQGKDVHRNLGDTQKIVGDNKNITTSITEKGDLKVELNKKIEVEKLSIPNEDGGESVSISSENGAGNIYLAGKPGENGKATGAKISVEEGNAGVEAKEPKEKMERIVYQDSKGNSHTVATHDDGLKFQGDDGKTIHKKLNETLRITGGEKDSKKLSQGNVGVISMEDGGLTIQLAKELKDLSKITLVDGNGKKAVIDGGSLVFEGEDGKKTSLTSNGLNNGGNRITNVAAGEAPTDAVNVSQLNEVKGAVQQNAQRIDKMNGEMRRGLASAAAMSGLEFMEIGINQGTVAAAVGGWKGTQAVAVGIQGAPTENVRINGKVSVAPGYKQVDTMYSVGASYRFNWK
ncbi:YadA-like family protein [Fusobacterium necrophorum]|nr:YadA-like family protein [Fusobacterium necrophorum]